MYPIEIFINFSAYYDIRAATLLSLPLISVTLLLVWGQMGCMRGKSYVSFERRDAVSYEMGRSKPLLSLFPCVILTLAALMPLGILFKESGRLDNYVKAFQTSYEQILYSISISAIAAFLMICFSVPVSYYLERTRGTLRTFLDYLTQLPFGLPSIVMGIGLIHVWNREGLDRIYESSAILIIAFVSAYSPFVIKIISAKIRQINPEFEEAAHLGTGSSLKVFWHIFLPLAFPGIMAGFLTGFVLSLSNLGTALLVIAPGKATLPLTIYNFMHYGAEEMVFALSLLLLFTLMGAGMILYPLYMVSESEQ